MKPISFLCIGLLIFFSGCTANTPDNSNAPYEEHGLVSTSSNSSSIPSATPSDGSAEGVEQPVPRKHVYAFQMSRDGFVWQNTVENEGKVQELWEILQRIQKTEPIEQQPVPLSGTPVELVFSSGSDIKHNVIIFDTLPTYARIDYVGYEVQPEDFYRMLELILLPDDSIPANEEAVQWDSVYVHEWNPIKENYIDWENTIDDKETIAKLWALVQYTKETKPADNQYAPDGGVPIELDFSTASGGTLHAAFFQRCAHIGDVWYQTPYAYHSLITKLTKP